jgi:hypothetical protein
MNGQYILDDAGEPVPEPDILKWGRWMEGVERLLIRTELAPNITVSTVFLGLDHGHGRGNNLPILWETMIFGGPHTDYQERYTSREAALVGHEMAVALARGVA